jgi:hypothetical protein
MLQWLGPAFDRKIIYNDFRDGAYKSVVLDVFSGEEKVVGMPVYSVDRRGHAAYSLDFARLGRLRPGYGYNNIEGTPQGEKCPDAPCLFKIDLTSGDVVPLLKYTDLRRFETRESMVDAVHRINHIMVSPDGTRLMLLHRWKRGRATYTRLVTCGPDGRDLFNLLDDDMTSHCNWLDDQTIIAYARKKGMGDGYYRLTDRTERIKPLFPALHSDGHPCVSPDGKWVATDTYPDKRRRQHLYLCDLTSGTAREIASFHAPFKYDNDTRCDLHPRFSPDGRTVCVDAACDGRRALYAVDTEG